MDLLKIERTQFTPEVIFDADEFFISIRGVIRPENAKAFFKPLISWIEDFHAQHLKISSTPLNVEIKLLYYNSASFIQIIDLFKIIKKIHHSGMKVIIEWYYNEDDDLMREAGQELSDISELPFIFIEE
jgi:hypothetical protein